MSSEQNPPSLARTTILLREYASSVEATDRFGKDEVQPIVLGLFGEVGSVMSAVKKHKREGSAFLGFRKVVEEEFGDTKIGRASCRERV
jgi:hypothetical protein